MKTVGIVGLGLIGGSMARAYKLYSDSDCQVLGMDRDKATLDVAMLTGAVDRPLTVDNIGTCELLLIALFPGATVDFLRENASRISPDALVIDLCGIKQMVCEACFPLAKQYGFTYIGGHPMAGTHKSGFSASRAELFRGAPMVLVPPRFDDIALLERAKRALAPAGFGRLSVTTAQAHDAMIAFTSQLAHIVSGAYIKSPTARKHKGFSAGSYRDMTRVAWLNPDMWTELFLENGECLTQEIDNLIGELQKYRDAIAAGDEKELWNLLDEGRRIKEEVDGV